jgi:fumiquinazoline A oxidase
MIGATLGRGTARYNGLHGMISDAPLSVRLVTAAGDIVTASASENSELFWGMRGAGFNFGIVLSATYQVYDLTNGGMVMNADFLFPANASTAVFQYFKSLENNLPAKLALIFQTGYNLDFGGVGLTALYFAAHEVDQTSFSIHTLSSMPPMQAFKRLAPL